MSDVIVVGGGVIGLSTAWELASHGAAVTVIDQSTIGREASWAGAGMLPPGKLSGETSGEGRLRALSCELWPEWTQSLCSTTGIDNGYHNCGAIEVSFDRSLNSEAGIWTATGNSVEFLTSERLRHVEPEISATIKEAYRLDEFCQVRNPRHLKALATACINAGVEFREGMPVYGWRMSGDRVTHVRTTGDDFSAGQFVICSGAWSRQLSIAAGGEVNVEPMRGQIVLLRCPSLPFRHVIQDGPRYLVPRADGRILIGSTEERAGFVKQNTVDGVQSLLQFAVRLVPALASAEIERTWSGLRPYSGREEPFITRLPGRENLFVAAGHFRSGLQMSPGTAVLVRQMLQGHEPSIPMPPYSLVGSESEQAELTDNKLLTAQRQQQQ
ncbi:MAG: glycine oxidase ThiO [Planctomycetaceae bacterium]|nr:glycine oxidase ThiO [Planctomycetaceae bacterium]